MPVAITVTHRTRPGMRDDVRKVWDMWMPDAVAAHAGHLFYAYTFDQADADVIRAFQIYTDAAAAQDYLQDASYQNYVVAVESLLAAPPEVTMADVKWSKGLTDAR